MLRWTNVNVATKQPQRGLRPSLGFPRILPFLIVWNSKYLINDRITLYFFSPSSCSASPSSTYWSFDCPNLQFPSLALLCTAIYAVSREKYLLLRTEPGRWSSPMELLKKKQKSSHRKHSTMNYQFQQSRTTTMNCPLQLTTATSSTMLNQPQHGLTEATSSCAMPQLNKQSSACPMPELRRGITPPVVLPASMPTFGAPSKKSDLLDDLFIDDDEEEHMNLPRPKNYWETSLDLIGS